MRTRRLGATDSITTIQQAFVLGTRWIETVPPSGLGRGEGVVGRGVRDRGERFKCAASLKRLSADAMDSYHVHWSTSVQQIDEPRRAIDDLLLERKACFAGVSNVSSAQMVRRPAAIRPVALPATASRLARTAISSPGER